MNEFTEVSVSLTNDKVQFTGTSRSNPDLVMDYFPPYGDGEGYTGLEMLLMSLANCTATSLLVQFRKMGKSINSFRVNAKGIRNEQPPTAFSVIYLELLLDSPDIDDSQFKNALVVSEDYLCPVWAMLKDSVEIKVEYTITENIEVE